jgi:hypothetical protein
VTRGRYTHTAMNARRLLSRGSLLMACAVLLLPSVGNAGLFSKTPKTPPLLGSHPSADAKDARKQLLKGRQVAVPARTTKAPKTLTSQRSKPGKTALGSPVKRK